jgi:predicted unusual protein kinase regulating ubiquinone biosynthesis (AarF/ABC1/UbiB family)
MLRARYNRITFFFARILLSFIFWELLLPRIGLKGTTQRTRSRRLSQSGAQFRSLAIEMGGLLIKLGQFFSARVDVLPVELTSELTGLQDEVTPEKFEDLRRLATAEFGVPLAEKYLEFEEAPLAAASLGQVHRAKLRVIDLEQAGTGNSVTEWGRVNTRRYPPEVEWISVVVKIQRPNIESIIQTDIAALRTVGSWLHRYKPIRRRMHIPSLLEEFTRISLEEIDYIHEGQNAEVFRENFKDQTDVCVPKVFWSHTTKRVLTLEDVLAIKITDYAAIKAAGIDPGKVARHLIDTYLKQIFEDGFFHADPHPGNLFVFPVSTKPGTIDQECGWQLTFVDFGMVGRVPEHLQAGIREAAIGVGTRDSERLTRAYQMLGLLLPDADLSLLKQAEEKIFDRFWGKDMSELRQIGYDELGELAYEFRGLLYSMPFQLPEDFILLGRAIGILSGICTGLDPNFNVWESIAPYTKRLLQEDAAGRRPAWLEVLESMAQVLIRVPGRLDGVLDTIEKGELAVQDVELSRQVARIAHALQIGAAAVIFGALLLGGIELHIAQDSLYSQALLSLAGVSMMVVLFLVVKGRE